MTCIAPPFLIALLAFGLSAAGPSRLAAQVAPAPAAPQGGGVLVELPLANGDRIRGTLIESNDYRVTIEHPVLGWLTLPRTALALPADAPLTADALAAPPPPPPEPPPAPEPEPSPWSGSFDFGLTGSSGNTDEGALHSELKLRRKDDAGTFDARLQLDREETDGSVTADRRFAESRYTWEVPDSPWGPFAQGSWEDDRFKDFDDRYSVGGGAAYTHRDDEQMRLVSRYGLGVVTTSGGDEDGTSPEAILGLDFERQLDERKRFTSLVELLPDLSELGEYRARLDAALEWDVDDQQLWRMKLGASANHDSTPGDADETDVYYFLSLGRKF